MDWWLQDHSPGCGRSELYSSEISVRLPLAGSILMINLLPVIIIAVIGGIAIALQAHLMGLLDKGVGTLETVFITYGSVAVMLVGVWLVVR